MSSTPPSEGQQHDAGNGDNLQQQSSANLGGQPEGPADQPTQPQFGPDGQPLQPGGYQGQPQFGPDGQPLPLGGYQGQPQFGPDGQPLPQGGYQGQPQFGPDGQPLQPGGYPPAAGGFMPQPPVPKKSGTLKRILTSVGIALIAIVIGVVWRSGVFDSPSMKAGDCVQKSGEDSVKVVQCGTAEAQYKVLGIVEKQSRTAGQFGACKAWPDATTVYWEGRNSGTGTVYCLQQL